MNHRTEHDDSDTVSLLDAARRFGIGKSMAYDLAKRGSDLTDGVRILRFGTTSRPVYRVPKAQIAAVLAPRTADGATSATSLSGPSKAATPHGRGEPRGNGDVAGPDNHLQDATGSSSTSSRMA